MERTKYRGIYFRNNKDGTKSYYVRCTIRGRRTRICAGSTVSAAKRFQAELKEVKWREKHLGIKIPERITFCDLADKYLEDYLKRKGDSNYARVKSSVKKLNGCFGHMQVSLIKEIDIDRAGLPRADLIILKAVLGRGKRWDYLADVPEFDMPRKARKLDRVISDEELNRILDQASELHRDAILLCLYLGGMRLGELTKTNRENTDFKAGTIDIQERKADQPKTFYMIDFPAKILRRRFMQNGGVAFTQTSGKLSQMFLYERKKMVGVKPWRFHDLRHSVATYLIGQGVDIETVRMILGHSSIGMTQGYSHTNEKKQREALEKMGKYIESIGENK